MRRWVVLAWFLLGLTVAQMNPWPPKLETSQVWSVTLSIGSQVLFWRVRLDKSTQGVFGGVAIGADARAVEVGYFGPDTPESKVQDRLVFSLSEAKGVSSFPQAFLCGVSQNGSGAVPNSSGGCSVWLELH